MHNASTLFNDGWSFKKTTLDTTYDDLTRMEDFEKTPRDINSLSAEELIQIGSEWMTVEIPHDWMIYNSINFDESCIGWYKKTFTKSTEANVAHEYITFDGVYMNSTVFINGVQAFEWKYGYSTFSFDMTPYLKDGDNLIVVRVIMQFPNSRWYSGAGIYRNVYRTCVPKCHFAINGSYYHTAKNEEDWTLHCEYEILDPDPETILTVRVNRIDSELTELTSISAPLSSFEDPAHPIFDLSCTDPALWDVNEPNRYIARAALLSRSNPENYDVVCDTIGFKYVSFTTDEGFFLNGKPFKIHGACEHHDLGSLGSAVNINALERQLVILKEMGVNSIRTSHNMPARELMDLADSMGFLIDSEAFDMWQRPKTEYDYARFFDEWHARDVESWIKRDRNHVSVIMWSIGNEISDTHADPDKAMTVIEDLCALVRKYDPYKNSLLTFGSNYMPWIQTQRCAELLEVVGYNYAEYIYDEHHEKYPHWIMYGSETASTAQSRSVYHFPLSQFMLSNDDMQCSTLGNCSTSWGAKNSQYCITMDRDRDYILGQYIWSGFDYIGEPTPYFTKNTYLGQIDTAGYPKDTYYAYQAEWTDYRTAPMVHVFPYWDFNEGQLVDVRVFSNCPKVEFFLDDISLGQKELDHKNGTDLSLDVSVPYKKGTLKAVGYDENGNVIATDVQSSFEDPAYLVCEAEQKDSLVNDGKDLLFLNITCRDKDGHFVANARNRVEVIVEGAARLVGLDNGDSTDYDSYKGVSRRLFFGRLLAILAPNGEEGPFTVTLRSEGLTDTVFEGRTLGSGSSEHVYIENRPYKHYLAKPVDGVLPRLDECDAHEISVRKLELSFDGSRKLTAEHPSVTVSAKLLPENATDMPVVFRVVNNSGVDTNLATVTPLPAGKSAVIIARGDGEFRLRCQGNNGRDMAEVLSDIEMSISGMGNALTNPYEFVFGALYTDSNSPLTNGNERGVASARDGETVITFDDIDFGDYGSDTITLPIFFNSNDVLHFEVYEGMPGRDENPVLLLNGTYQKKSIWNTYIEETYKLSKRLKGITTLSFVLHEKIHLKGFVFAKNEKAYSPLDATDIASVTGDTFKIDGNAIYGIGNNVSITYEGLDFGEDGFKAISITGRANVPVNPVHIRFKTDAGPLNQVVDFEGTDEPVTKVFPLQDVKGLHDLTVVFMPGSNFDLHAIQFVK